MASNNHEKLRSDVSVQAAASEAPAEANGRTPEAEVTANGNGRAHTVRSAEFELTATLAREHRLIAERGRLLRSLEELSTENAQLSVLRDELDMARDACDEARGARADATTELEAVRAERDTALDELTFLAEELHRAERLRRVHEDLLASLSWRMTRPLRWGIAQARRLFRRH